MTHDFLCKGGDCTCTCDELQEGHRLGCPGEDCDCLFIAEIRTDERDRLRKSVSIIPFIRSSGDYTQYVDREAVLMVLRGQDIEDLL